MIAKVKKRQITRGLIFLTLLVAGLFYVKWNPYYHKAILAATKHFIGNSSIPPYLIFVFLLGGVRAWLFPAVSPGWAEGLGL